MELKELSSRECWRIPIATSREFNCHKCTNQSFFPGSSGCLAVSYS